MDTAAKQKLAAAAAADSQKVLAEDDPAPVAGPGDAAGSGAQAS